MRRLPIDTTHRARSVSALFAGVGLAVTGFIALITVTPLAAEDLLGDARFSGLPSALAIIGTAVGTSWLAGVMARRGRRRGLVLGYFTAAVSAAIASVAVGFSIFPLLLVAIFTLGAGYGASRLSRYAAADLYEPERQARAIGWVVWAGTIGSVLGPVLLEPARRASAAVSLPDIMGPFLLASIALGAAGLALLVAFPADGRIEAPPKPTGWPGAHLREPNAQIALAALVAGACLVASGLISSRADGDQTFLAIGLFLLGWGWNLGFVSGSALLTAAVPSEDRTRLQGFADSIVWTSAAAAGASSGLLLHSVGYPSLCQLGTVVAVVPTALIVLRRS